MSNSGIKKELLARMGDCTEVWISRLPIDICNGLTKREYESKAGRQLLYEIVEERFGIKIEPKDIELCESGKPCFSEDAQKRFRRETTKIKEKLFFNISHSGEYVVCAFSEREVGCDIQKIRKIPARLYPYLASVQTEETDGNVGDLSLQEQTMLWTRYESLGKCAGTGIPIPEEALEESEWKEKYCWDEYLSLEGYVVSVCEQMVLK